MVVLVNPDTFINQTFPELINTSLYVSLQFHLEQHFLVDCRVENSSLWCFSLSSGAKKLTAVTTYEKNLAHGRPQMEIVPMCFQRQQLCL